MAAKLSLFIGLACASLLGMFSPASAQSSEPAPPGVQQAEQLQGAVDAMQKVLRPGPSDVTLLNQANLHVPERSGFVPQPEAGRWATASGYGTDQDLVGVVVPSTEENWIVFIDYHANTRIVDDEARGWDTDVLLQSLKIATDQGNAERKKQDLPQIEVTGWLEKPVYDSTAHKLIWAANSPEKGDNDNDGSANIHAYALGRDGYFEMTLVSPASEVASHVAVAKAVLAGLQFGIGRRYEDYASSRDIKEKGITSLISNTSASAVDQLAQYLAKSWIWFLSGLIVLVLAIWGVRRAIRR